MKNPFKSARLRRVEPDAEPVAPHLLSHGWGPPTDPSGAMPLDPYAAERSARTSGALALADLQKRDGDRKRDEMDARLAGVRQGVNYSKGLGR